MGPLFGRALLGVAVDGSGRSGGSLGLRLQPANAAKVRQRAISGLFAQISFEPRSRIEQCLKVNLIYRHARKMALIDAVEWSIGAE